MLYLKITFTKFDSKYKITIFQEFSQIVLDEEDLSSQEKQELNLEAFYPTVILMPLLQNCFLFQINAIHHSTYLANSIIMRSQ